MEYTVKKLAELSGVSARTLRYYDYIGLLSPKRVSSNGYRVYGEKEVDTLQQILFYRELELSLAEIKVLLTNPGYDREKSLRLHRKELEKKRDRIVRLIENVTKTIDSIEGEITMSDKEKFEGFKRKLISENERNYGVEVREKYGDSAVEESNAKVMALTQEQYDESERLLFNFEQTLKDAFFEGNPAGELAQKACELHKEWLSVFYPGYTKEYHMGLAEMYVADERFRVNYDKLAPGCTEFLRDAISIYTQSD